MKKAPLLILAALLLAGTLIGLGLHAYQKNLERETEIAAANYDGKRLIEKLGTPPETKPLDFLETKVGPIRRDMRNRDEAWLIYKQPAVTQLSFEALGDWHAERLRADGWTRNGAAEFARHEWRLRLERLPDEPAAEAETPAEAGTETETDANSGAQAETGTRYVRHIEWNRSFPAY